MEGSPMDKTRSLSQQYPKGLWPGPSALPGADKEERPHHSSLFPWEHRWGMYMYVVHQCFIQRVGNLGLPTPNVPPSSSFADFCHVLVCTYFPTPRASCPPILPSQKSWFYMKHCTCVHSCTWHCIIIYTCTTKLHSQSLILTLSLRVVSVRVSVCECVCLLLHQILHTCTSFQVKLYMYMTYHPQFSRLGTSVTWSAFVVIFITWESLSKPSQAVKVPEQALDGIPTHFGGR